MGTQRSPILGLLVLIMALLMTLSEPRPLSEEDLGIVIGPNVPDDEQGTASPPPPIDKPKPEPAEDDEIECPYSNSFSRASFPKDFIFGTATSAFQVEGTKNGAGRGLTTWDEFTVKFADKVIGRGDATIAVDFYNRYKEDIQLMKDLNTNGFRFSISWTRILPQGRESKGACQEGIRFYNNLIDELIKNGIQPAATLFHWEIPLTLEEEYGGFLDKRIVEDFRQFSKICFENFGDRVKNWATFNEPWVYGVAGYSAGKKAPGRCSKYVNTTCLAGDSAKEPYIASHHQILAHVAAVEEFRKCAKCQENGGKIGIVFNSPWFEPYDPESSKDREAVKRSLEFQLGWFIHPLTYGDYPSEMKEIVGSRLPSFTTAEKEKLINSMDFVGLNYYGAFFATYRNGVDQSKVSYANDHAVDWLAKTKNPSDLKPSSMGIVIYAKGLRSLLKYIKDNYKNPEIYIMENGADEHDDGSKPLYQALQDDMRRDFIRDHLWNLEKSLCQDKVRVKGYFIWSLMDNFEWNLGYHKRFGLYHVNYEKNLTRRIRSSGEWLRDFLREPGKPSPIKPQRIATRSVELSGVRRKYDFIQSTDYTPRSFEDVSDNTTVYASRSIEAPEIEEPVQYTRYVSDMM